MANSSFVKSLHDGLDAEIVVQGFREGDGKRAYVFLGAVEEGEASIVSEFELTPENAHILSEEIRKHAEFSLSEGGE